MRNINLEQLKTFLSVIRLGGIHNAARALHLTQPAVSARIKNLETTISAELFERTPAGLKLTKRGELLVQYAKQFEHLSELVERDVMHPEGIERRLRLGVSETISQCWLPQLVSNLHDQFPNLEIEINVDISVNLRAGLMNKEIDLAILLGPISEYSVDNINLPVFELAWYAAARMEPPDDNPSSYLSMPIISYARNTRPYRELKSELFERVGASFSIFPSSSLSACFKLVEAGLGVAALPKVLGNPLVEAGVIQELSLNWTPSPLQFTASFFGDPKSHMVEKAAKTALQVAQAYSGDK